MDASGTEPSQLQLYLVPLKRHLYDVLGGLSSGPVLCRWEVSVPTLTSGCISYSPETSLKAWSLSLSTLSPAQDMFRVGGEALCKDAQISIDKFLSELSDAVPSEGAEK